jgi:hypothetical protein
MAKKYQSPTVEQQRKRRRLQLARLKRIYLRQRGALKRVGEPEVAS